ncbi:phosphatase PAP2 family protein [Embleya sp. NPDC056575]|uniref:phosphatase PAP2 family protein n=1 Tax=unclassified Embleya TaxID=2699296 RepID=UPI0036807342
MTAPMYDQAMDGARIDGDWYTAVTDFAHDTPWLNATALAWTTYGAALFVVLLCVGWWRARRADAATMTAALATIAATGIAYLVNSGIKDAFVEPRPCRALPHAFLVEACPAANDYAFPSNHTTVAFAAAVGLLLVDRRLGVLALIAAVLMGASRVYVGAHYPHDIAAAALVGGGVALITVLPARRLATSTVARLRTGPLRPILLHT